VPKYTYVECLECDAEIECERVWDESGYEYADSPDECPECGAEFNYISMDEREDFHSDV
jgi:hypothetical protein